MNAVDEGKQIVDDTASKLMESAGKTNELVENIAEISNASENQSEALAQISEAANQIAAVVQENTAMAEESSASSEELAAPVRKTQRTDRCIPVIGDVDRIQYTLTIFNHGIKNIPVQILTISGLYRDIFISTSSYNLQIQKLFLPLFY